jgi:NAD(P)-dependent dehydrogenase (short-subunit alcohol dehydrogenase family)
MRLPMCGAPAHDISFSNGHRIRLQRVFSGAVRNYRDIRSSTLFKRVFISYQQISHYSSSPPVPSMATKVALVTASSAGLGAATVKALAPHFRVVVNYHSRLEKAEQVIKEASSIPPAHNVKFDDSQPRFHAIKADCSKRSEIERLVSETVSKMGRLDVVVSNAGWTRLTNFFDLEQQVVEDDWDRCFNVNVKSHLWLLYAAKPHLEKTADEGGVGGAFVTIASLAGVRPSGSSLPYSVTKAAEIHLTKGLAMICGRKVRCNSVSPGLMMTEW